MPTEIYLVKAGMTMTEGMVSEWYVPDGGRVERGELLYALETEKINLDVDAEASGTVKHLVETNIMLEPGAVVGLIFAANESIPDDLASVVAHSPPPDAVVVTEVMVAKTNTTVGRRTRSSPAARRLAGQLGVDIESLSGTGPGGRIVEADIRAASSGAGSSEARTRASPSARRIAREKGVDITAISGSGPGGRIVKQDVEQAVRGSDAGTVIPLSGMRKTIARRMHESLQGSAQLTMHMEVVMDDAVKMREQLITEWEAEGIRPTYTDIVLRATAKALKAHPLMNSQFQESEIVLIPDVHVGIAVSLDDGLVVPVIRDADQLTLKQITIESDRLAKAARAGSLGLDEFAGGTFTVTALGMYGVDAFTPIINAPQAGILGVNRIYDGLSWMDDRPVRSKRMNLSLTWDHRVLDGVPAAAFLAEVKTQLEAPYRLLV